MTSFPIDDSSSSQNLLSASEAWRPRTVSRGWLVFDRSVLTSTMAAVTSLKFTLTGPGGRRIGLRGGIEWRDPCQERIGNVDEDIEQLQHAAAQEVNPPPAGSPGRSIEQR